MEVVAIAVAAMVFGISWATQKYRPYTAPLVLGVGFLGVALLDLSHALSYSGMPDFVTPSGAEKGINFWLAARLLAALVLLQMAFAPRTWAPWARPLSRHLLLLGMLLLVAVVHWVLLFQPHWVPQTYHPEQGLTRFKIGFEYGLIALYVLAAVGFLRSLRQAGEHGAASLALASLTMAMSEYFFTLYANVSDIYNVVGHVYKVMAYGFLYRALFVESVQRPYQDLQAMQAQQLATLEALPDLLFEVDPQGVYLDVHASETGKLAAPATALLGRRVHDVLPPEAAAIIMQALQEAQLHGITRGQRIAVPLPNGATGHFELSVAAKYHGAQRPETFLVLSRDITAAVVAERQLEREALLKMALLDLQAHRTQEQDDAFIERAVHHAKALTGSAHACFGLCLAEGAAVQWLAGGDAVCGQTGPWQEVLQRRQPLVFNDAADERPPQDPSLQPEPWRRGLGVPVLQGTQVRLLALVANKPNDYTEHELQALQSLARELWRLLEQRQQDAIVHQLSEALEQSPHSVLITDTDSRIQYVNRAFSDASGYSLPEVLGQNPRMLQSGDTPAADYRAFWQRLGQGQSWQGEFINRHKDGHLYTEQVSVYPIRDRFGQLTHYVAHKVDITQRKAAEARIRDLSDFDALTGLLNKKAFDEKLIQSVDQAADQGTQLFLLWFNLDNFKVINETMGHTVGDELLVEMANRLRHSLGNRFTLARHAGDTFVAMVPQEDQARVALLVNNVLAQLQEPLVIGGSQVSLGASVGIAAYPSDAKTASALASAAEVAMYRVKQEGRNGLRFFAPEMQEHTQRSLDLAVSLKGAQDRGELRLVYQPQRPLGSGQLVGAEALLRWQHPRWGMVSPAEFIPIAEQTGLIVPIGLWVLEQAARQLQQWDAAGLPPLRVAVNVSAVQFARPGLVEEMLQVLHRVGVPAHRLEIEMTEAVALKNPEQAGAIIQRLHVAGFRVSLDDFGTGYSSMSYLRRYAIDKLKIDQSFVRDLAASDSDQAIVTAIIQMAHSLRMTTIAEGVETTEQAALLQACGCDEMQGYLYSPPLDPAAFATFAKGQGQ